MIRFAEPGSHDADHAGVPRFMLEDDHMPADAFLFDLALRFLKNLRFRFLAAEVVRVEQLRNFL